jgi:hypothetical protein
MNFEIVKQNSLKNRQFLGCFLIQPQKSATFNKKWQKSATRNIVIPRAGVGFPSHRRGRDHRVVGIFRTRASPSFPKKGWQPQADGVI